jgi:hypothetical protein
MQSFQDIEHFVKTLSAAIKKKIPTKVSQLTNDVGYKTTDTNTTYELSKSGSTVTLTGSDGSTTSVTDSNTTYSSLKNPYSLDIQNNGTTVASYDGSTAKTANFTNATSSANGLMSAADKKAVDREFFRLLPKGGTHIPVNADLNSIEYLKVGNYYSPSNAESRTIKNAPSGNAFIMYVLSPLSEVYDNESAAPWVYRLRIFVEHTGTIFTQLVSSGTIPGSFNYGPWIKQTNSDDLGAVSNVINDHIANKSNPHAVTKAQVGLGSVANLDQSKAIKSITRSGTTFTATALDGTTTTFTQQDNNTTYGIATSSSDGLMSKADKAKLDGIGAEANVKSVNGKTGAVSLSKADVGLGNVDNTKDADKPISAAVQTALDAKANNSVATSSADGLMSKSDKAKLDGISSGADVSQIQTVKVNGTALTPDSSKAVNVTVPTLANNATTTAGGMALDARMGKTLSDQISSVKAGAIDQIVNLTAAGWTGDAAPYSQTVNVTGMTEDLLCELFSACPKTATVAEREAYNEAFSLVASGYAETADGSATFLVDEKPAIDIGVRIKSISKANAVSDQTSSDITNAVDAMGNTLEGRITSLWEKIYPVGSIYISANSTSPANLFGGTWEQIKDRFLLAAGGTYAAGSTGGEATHTLTVDEMPNHVHPYAADWDGGGGSSHTHGEPWALVMTTNSGDGVGEWAFGSDASRFG